MKKNHNFEYCRLSITIRGMVCKKIVTQTASFECNVTHKPRLKELGQQRSSCNFSTDNSGKRRVQKSYNNPFAKAAPNLFHNGKVLLNKNLTNIYMHLSQALTIEQNHASGKRTNLATLTVRWLPPLLRTLLVHWPFHSLPRPVAVQVLFRKVTMLNF